MGPVSHERRQERWTVDEVLEQVRVAPGDSEKLVEVAQAVLRWAREHRPFLRVLGGTGSFDRSLIIYAGPGRGRGVLTLYADGNGGGPKLEVQIDYLSIMSPRDYREARARMVTKLRSCDIPRLLSDDVLTMARPSVPLSQLVNGRLESLLSVIDEWIAEVS